MFQKILLDHVVDNPPNQIKIFEKNQVAKILEYINKTYCDKFSLYKYVFQNKKSNEEIKYFVYIDEPIVAPPLYMAQN